MAHQPPVERSESSLLSARRETRAGEERARETSNAGTLLSRSRERWNTLCNNFEGLRFTEKCNVRINVKCQMLRARDAPTRY